MRVFGICGQRLRIGLLTLLILALPGVSAPAAQAAGTPGAAKGGLADSSFMDMEAHWARDAVESLRSKELLSGYQDGRFRPEEAISRAEWVALLNRMAGLTRHGSGETADTPVSGFADVPKTAWYSGDVAIALKEGYVQGSKDGKFRPREKISRQEAAAMLGRLLRHQSATALDKSGGTPFTDADKLAEWAAGDVMAMVQEGLIAGKPDGAFEPRQALTRAEAAVISVRLLDWLERHADSRTYSEAGVYGETPGKVIHNVTSAEVTAGGVTLRNIRVLGDLVLAASIGDGEVTLDHVQVDGELVVEGGRKISLNGRFAAIRLEKAKVDISLTSGSIGVLEIAQGSDEAKVRLAKETSVDKVELRARAGIYGTGNIRRAEVFANEAIIEQMPEQWELADNIRANIGGKWRQGNSRNVPSVPSPGSGGGSGGSGNGGDPVQPPKLELEQPADLEMETGDTMPFPVLAVKPSGAVLSYVSEAPGVVAVDEKGSKLSAVAAGKAGIKVKAVYGSQSTERRFEITVGPRVTAQDAVKGYPPIITIPADVKKIPIPEFPGFTVKLLSAIADPPDIFPGDGTINPPSCWGVMTTLNYEVTKVNRPDDKALLRVRAAISGKADSPDADLSLIAKCVAGLGWENPAPGTRKINFPDYAVPGVRMKLQSVVDGKYVIREDGTFDEFPATDLDIQVIYRLTRESSGEYADTDPIPYTLPKKTINAKYLADQVAANYEPQALPDGNGGYKLNLFGPDSGVPILEGTGYGVKFNGIDIVPLLYIKPDGTLIQGYTERTQTFSLEIYNLNDPADWSLILKDFTLTIPAKSTKLSQPPELSANTIRLYKNHYDESILSLKMMDGSRQYIQDENLYFRMYIVDTNEDWGGFVRLGQGYEFRKIVGPDHPAGTFTLAVEAPDGIFSPEDEAQIESLRVTITVVERL
ncbi:S-layer homology domain-containing protein [Paenibacillus timonensis]|uniref:S-layer homology domain-containing protein n=1 Tax=Paenibacillus timonensis TaxID=225915 RepID=A0ABW3SAB8_9BACL|nr:S-layer homology domain-containing protein [Paenibacillus timonensis]MCH1639789.1 S-layer homology domain-containing protein [Paenibacillus timonensis]